jgi:hypothetical protein
MIKCSEPWNTRSTISRWAHVLERTGLALAGAACGLFVAAHVGRADNDLIGSAAAVLAMMVYGAAGFYLGIDLSASAGPQAPPCRLSPASLRECGQMRPARPGKDH